MGYANPIRTLGDYSRPSHDGYRNTIELPEGNNMVPLRSDTIRLVQNGCSFHRLQSEDPNQYLKDFLKVVDSLDLDVANRERTRLRLFQFSLRDQASNWLERLPAGSISTWEDLTTRFLAQFFPPRRTAKHHNDILMSKLFLPPQSTPKTHDQRLLELEDQINFLLKGSRPTPRPSLTYVPQAYAEAVYSYPHQQNLNEPPKHNPFTFCERTSPNPQPLALGTTFEARVRDYKAAHTERMERFENAIFKQREEIKNRMTKMFRLLKELTTSKAPEKVLMREEAKHPVTKKVNSISLIRGEEEKNDDDNAMTGDSIEKPNGSDAEMPLKEAEKENEAENGTKNEPIKSAEKELTQAEEKEAVEAPNSQPVGYYLKHRINKKLIEGLVENHRFNDSLSPARDILVDVVVYVYPVDFVILDIKEDEKRPFILGTQTTAKAVIKFDKGTITLRSGKSKMSFHRIPESLGKIKKGIKNDIEPIALTMTVNRLVLEWEERIKLHHEKEMEFDQ
ncbi:MAK10-like protein [Tanacetum coccineum]